MNHITEHAGFAETSELLAKLQEEYATLGREQVDLWDRLSHRRPGETNAAPSSTETARVLLSGALPPTRGDEFSAWRDRELEVRRRLEAIQRVLQTLPVQVERQRDSARAEKLTQMAPKFDGVRSRFEAAVRELRAAVAAEDALREEVVAGGFGCIEPVVTSPAWLNRWLLVAQR